MRAVVIPKTLTSPLPQERERGLSSAECRPSLVTFCLFVQEAMLQSREIAMTLPLAGMRVLDVSQVMAGPFCDAVSAISAGCMKVEPPEGATRAGAIGFKLKGADSLGFLDMNRNKRSIALDLKTEEGRAVFTSWRKPPT